MIFEAHMLPYMVIHTLGDPGKGHSQVAGYENRIPYNNKYTGTSIS